MNKVEYNTKLVELGKELKVANYHLIPKLKKIVISSSLKDAIQNPKLIDILVEELSAIAGQKATVALAKKSIASFKLRKGQPVGAYVTLRGDRMLDFYSKLVNFSLPRLKDFRGLPTKSFDDSGNYTLGLKENVIFPELFFDKVEKPRGIAISFVFNSQSQEHSRNFLKKFNFPFKS
jgi:large subunit ribosomal protein L5